MTRRIAAIILTWFIILPGAVHGAAEQAAVPPLNKAMTAIGETMKGIYPLIVADRELTQDEFTTINHALVRLAELFKSVESIFHEKPDAYQISLEFISQYLQIVKMAMLSHQSDTARSYLYALGEICTSCHTQDTKLRTLFQGTGRDQFSSDYAFAEFNFMTRNYATAVDYYAKFLDTDEPKTELQIIQPLQRIVTIFTQINNSPDDGIRYLEKYSTLKNITPEVSFEIENWKAGLKSLHDIADSKKTVTFEQLSKYVERYLGAVDNLSIRIESTPREEVIRVWLRGQLYHYLNAQASRNEIPKLLYWLAITDRAIAYNFYFSLADLYLKHCVLRYAAHPIAGECFSEYMHFTQHTYTRHGLSIPPGIEKEIRQMREALARTSKK